MIECIDYTPINKGACLGECKLYVKKWGAKISRVSLYEKNGKRWVNMPYKYSVIDGVKKYEDYIEFDTTELKMKFGDMAKDAIDKYLCNLDPKDYTVNEESIY